MARLHCNDCGRFAAKLYSMGKDGKIKQRLCPTCKEKLEKEGWRVLMIWRS